MRSFSRGWLLAASAALACGCDAADLPDDPAAGFPVPAGTWRQVVPAATLPAAVTTFASNNNLDIAFFEGSVFLAFRTAPTHFASDEVLLHILRCDDPEAFADPDAEIPWIHEATLDYDTDLREPRMFVHDDKLFLYFVKLGTELTAFEPGDTLATVRDAGAWSAPVTIFADGRIAWRTKVIDDTVYMTAYRGGENIYQGRGTGDDLELHFLTTDDGWNWTGVDPARPVVLRGGISETDFEFADSGDLYAVSRNETGDASGFGSRLCRAPAGDYGNWSCLPQSDPNKYDSPFMFKYGPRLYLIARYNLGVPFDQFGGEPATVEHWWINEYRYSTTPKRTALYGYDTEEMRIVHLQTFPTNGDTSFAGGVWLDDKRLLVLNYSSDPDLPEMAWLEGQFVGSQIYAAVLTFP